MSRETRPQVVLVNRCFVIRNDGRLLALQRSADDVHHPGAWEIPGGKVEQGQTLSEGCHQEIAEETGLRVRLIGNPIIMDDFLIPDGRYAGLLYLCAFSIARCIGGELRLSSEHDDAKWVTLDEFLQLDLKDKIAEAATALGSRLRNQT